MAGMRKTTRNDLEANDSKNHTKQNLPQKRRKVENREEEQHKRHKSNSQSQQSVSTERSHWSSNSSHMGGVRDSQVVTGRNIVIRNNRQNNMVEHVMRLSGNNAGTTTPTHGSGQSEANTPAGKLSEITGASDSWALCERNAKTAVEQQADLQRFVKTEVFASLKMITNKHMLAFNTNPKTLCGWICLKMKVMKGHEQEWWEENKDNIRRALNNKKSDVCQAIKKAFFGEWCGRELAL